MPNDPNKTNSALSEVAELFSCIFCFCLLTHYCCYSVESQSCITVHRRWQMERRVCVVVVVAFVSLL